MTDHRQVMQQALEALQDITNYDKLAFARLALRQALDAAPQAEPVAWLVTTETQAGKRVTSALTGRYKDVRDACDFGEPVPLYTHPAPTTDVVRDAGRYRFIRDADRSGCIGHEISLYAMESLDEYVDAAMQGDAAMKGADQ